MKNLIANTQININKLNNLSKNKYSDNLQRQLNKLKYELKYIDSITGREDIYFDIAKVYNRSSIIIKKCNRMHEHQLTSFMRIITLNY